MRITKLKVTRRGLNIRSRRREAWEAATECGTWVVTRLEDEGTNWYVYRAGEPMWRCSAGSLKRAQRIVDTLAAAEAK